MSDKYIVPIGVLIGTILIIVGGYLILNPQNPSQTTEKPGNNAEFIENSSAEAHYSPTVSVSASELQKNAKPSFEIGKKYEYRTTTQQYCMVVDEIAPDGSPAGTSMSCSDAPTNETYKIVYDNHRGTEGTPNGTIYHIPFGTKYTMRNETIAQNEIDEFAVEKIERVNGVDCLFVSRLNERESSEESMHRGPPPSHSYYYYNEESGNLVQAKAESGSIESDRFGNILQSDITNTTRTGADIEATGRIDSMWFSEWMLALNDNFIWEKRANISIGEHGNLKSFTYAVKGREKVNNKDCFKVEITEKSETIKSSGENFVNEQTHILWVDVNERIMVEEITKSGSLTTSTTELVDES